MENGGAANVGSGPKHRPRVVVVGSGFAGFTCIRELEKRLGPEDAELILVSPTDYLLYSPLLPEVAAGAMDPRHVVVPLHGALKRARVVLGYATGVDLDMRTCTVNPPNAPERVLEWDRLVLAPGGVTRSFPIPGLAEKARGLKSLGEAMYLRDHVLQQLELADASDDPDERRARCTFVVVGAGYVGTEFTAQTQHFTRKALGKVSQSPPRREERCHKHDYEIGERRYDESRDNEEAESMNEETSAGAPPQVQARGQDAAMQTETRRASMTTENTPDSAAPDTIVLVHGLWVTPRSWEHWIEHYEGKGYRVLAPAYPGLEVEVEALNEDPSPIEALTIPAVVEHLEGIVGELDKPPIIMGHSAGGLFTQILLDHGYGAAGVAIDSAPAEGVRVTPVSQIRSLFPILRNPANRHRAVGFTKEQFHYAFTNTLSREESDEVYERYHVPAPGSFVWAGPLANFTPGHQDVYVNFRNEDRAPLLFIAGGEDNLMPPAVNQSNAKHYRHTNTVTDYKEFPGRSHYTVGQDGWEEVADYALEWAVEHAKRPAA